MPKGYILINKADADRLGFKPGDKARIVSASNPAGEWDVKGGQPAVSMICKLKAVLLMTMMVVLPV